MAFESCGFIKCHSPTLFDDSSAEETSPTSRSASSVLSKDVLHGQPTTLGGPHGTVYVYCKMTFLHVFPRAKKGSKFEIAAVRLAHWEASKKSSDLHTSAHGLPN